MGLAKPAVIQLHEAAPLVGEWVNTDRAQRVLFPAPRGAYHIATVEPFFLFSGDLQSSRRTSPRRAPS
jgi:hypothetical protein